MRLDIINELNNKHTIFMHLPKFVKENYLNELNEIQEWKLGEYNKQLVNRVQQFFHIYGEPFCKNWNKITERWKSLPYYSWLLEFQIKLQRELNVILAPMYKSYAIRPLNIKSALINKYRNGDDFIPPHFDTTEEQNPTIVSVSFGETREFVIKRISVVCDEPKQLVYKLKQGDVFIMAGLSQQNYTHELVKNKLITKPRYNITFR